MRGAQAVDALQSRRPAIGFVAEHRFEQTSGAFAVQALFDFTRGAFCAVGGPARCEAGVDEQKIQCAIDVHQWPRAQPVEYGVAVGCEQDFAQLGVRFGLFFRCAFGDGEQRKIVVAEDGDRARIE